MDFWRHCRLSDVKTDFCESKNFIVCTCIEVEDGGCRWADDCARRGIKGRLRGNKRDVRYMVCPCIPSSIEKMMYIVVMSYSLDVLSFLLISELPRIKTCSLWESADQ